MRNRNVIHLIRVSTGKFARAALNSVPDAPGVLRFDVIILLLSSVPFRRHSTLAFLLLITLALSHSRLFLNTFLPRAEYYLSRRKIISREIPREMCDLCDVSALSRSTRDITIFATCHAYFAHASLTLANFALPTRKKRNTKIACKLFLSSKIPFRRFLVLEFKFLLNDCLIISNLFFE